MSKNPKEAYPFHDPRELVKIGKDRDVELIHLEIADLMFEVFQLFKKYPVLNDFIEVKRFLRLAQVDETMLPLVLQEECPEVLQSEEEQQHWREILDQWRAYFQKYGLHAMSFLVEAATREVKETFESHPYYASSISRFKELDQWLPDIVRQIVFTDDPFDSTWNSEYKQ